jgi:hypothetical protein
MMSYFLNKQTFDDQWVFSSPQSLLICVYLAPDQHYTLKKSEDLPKQEGTISGTASDFIDVLIPTSIDLFDAHLMAI